MKRIGSLLMASGAAGLILSAFVAASSTAAIAQDAGSWSLSPSTGEAATQPDSKNPPLDLNGCWSGTIDDTKNGAGTGFLFFVQERTKLGVGTGAELDIPSLGSASGPLKGKANSQDFELGFHGKACDISFHGKISNSGDLTGMYHFSKKCFGQVLKGTFDYTFDVTSASCPE
jgi:hypothetical protein